MRPRNRFCSIFIYIIYNIYVSQVEENVASNVSLKKNHFYLFSNPLPGCFIQNIH